MKFINFISKLFCFNNCLANSKKNKLNNDERFKSLIEENNDFDSESSSSSDIHI